MTMDKEDKKTIRSAILAICGFGALAGTLITSYFVTYQVLQLIQAGTVVWIAWVLSIVFGLSSLFFRTLSEI